MYDNEAAVGTALATSGLKRANLFVSTKVWHDKLAPDALRRSFDASLGKLRLDHVNLFLVHWPSANMKMGATLEAITKLKEEGLARAIGVCNFNLLMIRHAVEDIGSPIAVHQVEYHPFLSQTPMLDYLRGKGIPMTAYAPLAQGRAAQDNRIGAVNIPASSTTYDVNGELRDRYVVRCLQSKDFTVKMDGHACATDAETKKALADRAAGQMPQCAVRYGS